MIRLGLGLGFMRSRLFGDFQTKYIKNLITNGFIPVADPSDLDAIRTTYSGGNKRIFALGSQWETEEINTDGIADKYVLTDNVDLIWTNPAWHTNEANQYAAGTTYKRGDLVWTISGTTISVWFWHSNESGSGVTPAEGVKWRLVRSAVDTTFANGWIPIPTSPALRFDGAYNIITNMFASGLTSSNQGLFRQIGVISGTQETAFIDNLLLVNGYISSSSNYVGLIAGVVYGDSRLSGCVSIG
jgi:hypothetical protein